MRLHEALAYKDGDHLLVQHDKDMQKILRMKGQSLYSLTITVSMTGKTLGYFPAATITTIDFLSDKWNVVRLNSDFELEAVQIVRPA